MNDIPDEIKKMIAEKYGEEVLDETYGDDEEIKAKYREQSEEYAQKQKKLLEEEELKELSPFPEKNIKFKMNTSSCKHCNKYQIYNNFDDDVYLALHGCCKSCWYKIEEPKWRIK